MAAPTPDRHSLRLTQLERSVSRLEQGIEPFRFNQLVTHQQSRLAITVPEIIPAGGGGDPTILYPLPPSDVFPIQFIDVVDNDIEEENLDLDYKSRADADGNHQTKAMHVRGEYVPRGAVCEVMFQRAIVGTKNAGNGQLEEVIEWWITDIHDAVAVYNNTGAEIPAHAVMVPGNLTGGKDYTPVTKPSTAVHPLYLVNSRYPIPNTKVGVGYPWLGRSGTVAKYDAQAANVGESWGPKPDSWLLHPNRNGFIVTRKIDDDLMTVVQTPVKRLLGKTAVAITKGGRNTVNIWTGPHNSLAVETGLTVQAKNLYRDLDSGKWCEVAWINGDWYIDAGEC